MTPPQDALEEGFVSLTLTHPMLCDCKFLSNVSVHSLEKLVKFNEANNESASSPGNITKH